MTVPNFADEIEVTFRFAHDMPWMRVTMSTFKYFDVLNGIPFESLTLKQILTESFADDEGNIFSIIYDTFEKTWSWEAQNVES